MPAPSAAQGQRVDERDTPSSQRRSLQALLVLALLCLAVMPLFVDRTILPPLQVQPGVQHLAARNFDQPVELAGRWRLTWLSGGPGTSPSRGTTMFTDVPGTWEGRRPPGQAALPRSGRAAYALTLTGLRPGQYRLFVPSLWAASEVWIGGALLSRRGVLGNDADSSRSHPRSHDVTFSTGGGPVELRIEIAAFHHRDNGLEATPVLAPTQVMTDWILLQWAQSLLFMVSLLLIGAYGLIVFLFRREDKASLLFALSCFCTLPIAAIFGHDNLLMAAFPALPFKAALTFQYLCGTLAVGFFMAYAHALFPGESSRGVFRVLATGLALALAGQVLVGLAGESITASYISQYTLPIRLLALLNVVAVVLLATVRGRDGAAVFLIGMGTFVLTATMRALVTNGVIRQDQMVGLELTDIGILVLLFSHIIVIAERWSAAIRTTEQTNDDLRRLLELNTSITSEIELAALLRKIVAETSRIVRADRGSLFLYDERAGELWSVVAEGLPGEPLRFDARLGLAGHVLTTGTPVNIADAYEDARFNRSLDAATGYRTRSVLTVPIVARDSRRLGVMQALNSRTGAAFTDEDVLRMSAFAAQAAVAIDNATLFSNVVSARNYNESILRSMSSGVITLDRDIRIAKLNRAASQILGLSPDGAEDSEARRLLAGPNQWLIEELDAVSRSGQSKTLLDVDITTAAGATASVNISIVPLMEDTGPVGLLLLIEDISEGKRLQSAMRRFMTQKVVDQVLGHRDDLLFGTSCEASVLFADIGGFTSLAENLEPRETVEMLNEVFTELFEAVAASDGVLDKFIGDAIMAVYGAPLSTGRDPENAVESAVQMLTMLDTLNSRRRGRGLADLRLGVGIATGEVIAGTIGSPKRMDYTVIGDRVNLAARLQDIAKRYGVAIIIDEGTAAAVRGNQPLRELDLIQVRGRRRPEKIFQVLYENGAFVNGAAVLAAYEEGRAALRHRDWAQAGAAFERALAANPADGPSRLMLERTRVLAGAPPGPDWTGVWQAQG